MNHALENLWGKGSIRAFISHVSDHREFAHRLKAALGRYDIAAFVAHDDIQPMQEWESEIVRALDSMDLLVALITPEFGNSDWTDQEVGFALGRKVLVLPVGAGKNPYGLLSKYQAIPANVEVAEIATEIFKSALGTSDLAERAVDSYIESLRKSYSFANSNRLADYMPRIAAISPEQETALVDVFNTNVQVAAAWDIKEQILVLLQLTRSNTYEITEQGKLCIRTDGH